MRSRTLSIREFHRLLRRLGCRIIRTAGGHAQWVAPTGEHFTTTGHGRRKDPGDMEIRAAARALGVSIKELLS